MRRALRHALIGAVLTVFAVTIAFGPILVGPAVLSSLGGEQTGTALPLTLVGTLGTLIALAASVGVGYREQRRHGVSRTCRRFGAAFLVGGVAVVLLAVVGLAAGGLLADTPAAMTVTWLLSALVAMPAVAVVAALAGLGAATFGGEDGDESAVTDATADARADGPTGIDPDERSGFALADGAPR